MQTTYKEHDVEFTHDTKQFRGGLDVTIKRSDKDTPDTTTSYYKERTYHRRLRKRLIKNPINYVYDINDKKSDLINGFDESIYKDNVKKRSTKKATKNK